VSLNDPDGRRRSLSLILLGVAGAAAFILLGLVGPRLVNLHEDLALIAAVVCYAAGLGLAGWCLASLIRR
jgi:hypothetical protein